jgi:hypothetical protein
VSGRDGPIKRCGFGSFVPMSLYSPCCREGRNIERALPCVGQLDDRLPLSPQGLRGDKALESKRVFPREQVIHGARQLVREYRQRFGFAVVVFEFRKILFAGLIVP